jgi:hypothetical protein
VGFRIFTLFPGLAPLGTLQFARSITCDSLLSGNTGFHPDPGTPLPRMGKPLAARQE